MQNAPDVKAIAHILAAHAVHTGIWKVKALHASSFCSTWRADGAGGAGGALFVKSVPAHQEHILTAEADGLRAIGATKTVTGAAVKRTAYSSNQISAPGTLAVRPDRSCCPPTGFALQCSQ